MKFYTSKNFAAFITVVMALLFIPGIWLFTFSRIHNEKTLEIAAEIRTNTNLAKSFEENVRRNLAAIDDILLFLQSEYKKHGFVTGEMRNRMNHVGHIPTVHVSLINEQGVIFASSLPGLVSMNVSTMEYFQHFKGNYENKSYFGRPIIGRLTKQPLFHMSRILYKADGSFGGALNFGVEPRYFSDYYQKMELEQGYSIAIVGRDGYVRVQQTKSGMNVGQDVRSGPVLGRIADKQLSGSFFAISPLSGEMNLISYVAMPDYPFFVLVAQPEKEVLASYYQRRGQYIQAAVTVTAGLVLALFLLYWLMAAKIKSERKSREQAIEMRARQLLQQEVDRAGKIQLEMLPGDADYEQVVIRTIYKPAYYVSGDHYYYQVSGDRKIVRGFLIDVTAHGIATALQASAVSAILRDEMNKGTEWTTDILQSLEAKISPHLSEESFVAVLLFLIDCKQQTLTCIAAGINFILLSNRRHNGWVSMEGGFLGVSSDMLYGVSTFPLQYGDCIYFATDGAYERMTPTEALPAHLFETSMYYFQQKADGADRRDDITVLGVKLKCFAQYPQWFEFADQGQKYCLQPRIYQTLTEIFGKRAFELEVALGEAINNALQYGGKQEVRVKLNKIGNHVIIRVRDNGKGFAGNEIIARIKSIGIDESLKMRASDEHGRGISIMMLMVDRVVYNREGNEVLLQKAV